MEKLTVDSVKNFETEVDYTTILDNFEGPLDLLLHLIKQEEIEIKDVFVSQVTEQFLSYMKGLPYIDPKMRLKLRMQRYPGMRQWMKR